MHACPLPWLNDGMPSTFASLSRTFALPLALFGSLALSAPLMLGCGSPKPAPGYPSPQDPAVEDTEFAEVLGLREADADEDVPAEDDWVDPSASDAPSADDSADASEKR